MLHLITHVDRQVWETKYRIPRAMAKEFDSLMRSIDSAGDRREGDRLDRYWEKFEETFSKYEVK